MSYAIGTGPEDTCSALPAAPRQEIARLLESATGARRKATSRKRSAPDFPPCPVIEFLALVQVRYANYGDGHRFSEIPRYWPSQQHEELCGLSQQISRDCATVTHMTRYSGQSSRR